MSPKLVFIYTMVGLQNDFFLTLGWPVYFYLFQIDWNQELLFSFTF